MHEFPTRGVILCGAALEAEAVMNKALFLAVAVATTALAGGQPAEAYYNGPWCAVFSTGPAARRSGATTATSKPAAWISSPATAASAARTATTSRTTRRTRRGHGSCARHCHSGRSPPARSRASSTRYGSEPGIQNKLGHLAGFRVRAFGAPRNDAGENYAASRNLASSAARPRWEACRGRRRRARPDRASRRSRARSVQASSRSPD